MVDASNPENLRIEAQKRLLEVISNTTKFHREHEKYYGQQPLETAIETQNMSKTLKTLADKWSGLQQPQKSPGNPYMGCEDLNEKAAIQHDGLLFMEGEGEPAEISRLKRRLQTHAEDCASASLWLVKAFESGWESAKGLVKIPGIEDVLGTRHRTIINDWQAGYLEGLVAKLIERALLILGEIEFTPKAIREDICTMRRYPGLLYSASELLDRAADLSAEFAMLVHDNEPRWRVFRQRIEKLSGMPVPVPSKQEINP